jgi:hypothetical protein
MLKYNYLKNIPGDYPAGSTYTDYHMLLAFFLSHYGRFDDFLFEDPDDKSVGPAMNGASPNLDAELQLVQDSGSLIWYSPLQRLLGGTFYEDIADIKGADSTVVVYANGSLQTLNTEYQIITAPGLAIPGYSFAGRYLQWASEPSTPITIAFNFYWRVHFEDDQQEFEKFLAQVWAAGGSGGGGEVKLESSRAYTDGG